MPLPKQRDLPPNHATAHNPTQPHHTHSARCDHPEKSLVEELEKIIIESDEQITRLNHSLAKLKQVEKNKEIFYQSKIAKLTNQNEEYRRRLQQLQGDKERIYKAGQSIRQSKRQKLMFDSCHPHATCNKENINTLNAYNQPCQNPLCIEQVEQINFQAEKVSKGLNELLLSLNLRSDHESNVLQKKNWVSDLQSEKAKWKQDRWKSILFLLRKVQKTIDELEVSLQKQSEVKSSGEPLAQAMKLLRTRQYNLSRIPFLERIGLEGRKEQYKAVIRECRRSQKRILQLIDKP